MLRIFILELLPCQIFATNFKLITAVVFLKREKEFDINFGWLLNHLVGFHKITKPKAMCSHQKNKFWNKISKYENKLSSCGQASKAQSTIL